MRRLGDQAKADPAAFVMRTSEIQNMAQAAFAEDAPPAARENYFEAVLQRQADMGISPSRRKVLTKSQSETIMASLEGGGPESYQAVLSGLSQYGRFESQVMSELIDAGLPREAEAVWTLSDDKINSTLLVDAMGQRKDLKSQIDTDTRKDIEDRVSRELEDLFETFAHSPDVATLQESYGSAATLIAQKKVLSGSSPVQAARDAVGAFTKQQTLVGSYRIPNSRDFSANDVQRGVRAIQNTLLEGRSFGGQTIGSPLNMWWGAPGDAKIEARTRQHKYREAIRDHGRWVTNADETGLELVLFAGGVTEPVRNKAGQRVAVSFDALADLGFRIRHEKVVAGGRPSGSPQNIHAMLSGEELP